MCARSAHITQLLERRGIALAEQETFLRPDFQRDTHDPFLLAGMEPAVERFLMSVKEGEKIALFGDYDADGVPAVALLVRAFSVLGAQIIPLIPLRSDGYGLGDEAVKRIEETGCSLLITVDNGTVAEEKIAYLKSRGVDTIVIDHHEPHGDHVAHSAFALVNPKQASCEYPFKDLCACALAWKFAQACYQKSGRESDQLRWLLDLVAISTVGDMVPLVGENRVLTVFGLKVLAKSRNQGLRALAEQAGFDLATVTAGDIGFKIAPRLNAPSRMHKEFLELDHAALTLLTTEDSQEAKRLARYVNEQNTERQSLVEATLKEAIIQADQHRSDLCTIVYAESWSSGVIGLVASKLVEHYKRPAIVLAAESGEDGGRVIRGSVRSLGDAHALTMLDAALQYVEQFGGHAKAAGLSLKNGVTVEDFRAAIHQGLNRANCTLERFAAALVREADITMSLREIDVQFADELAELAPFGVGFPAPAIGVEAEVSNLRAIGKVGQHRSCMLEADGVQRRAVAWGERGARLNNGLRAMFLVAVEAQTWRDVRSVNLIVNAVLDTKTGLELQSDTNTAITKEW